MNLFVAGPNFYGGKVACDEIRKDDNCLYILESFYYMTDELEKLIPLMDGFLLDSGAFTFMQNTKTKIDWINYIKRYAEFIRKNDIKLFFELDIDSIVGYPKVIEYRKLLENLTGRKCIPVWHKSRGIQEFYKMCDKYDYVAIGGIVTGEITKDEYKIFPQMIKEAHKRGAKVHGLGFTNLGLLPKIHFDSVDSTAWTTGNRFGHLYRFNGKTLDKVKVPKGKRLADSKRAAEINFREWRRFQKYAKTHFKKRCMQIQPSIKILGGNLI